MNDNSYRVIEVDINEILPNRFQPRIQFDEEEILELSDSIKEHGVIQPIVVRTIGDKYEIIAGERRYKASVLAGKETVPVIIKNLNDKDSAEIALIENIQRKNLTPIEEALSYKKILDMGYITQDNLASKLGKSQSSVANKIRLLNLSDEVQEALLDNKISERHARSLLRIKSLKDQNNMLERIIRERLTVRKTDEVIDKLLNSSTDKETNNTEKIIEKGVINMNNEMNQIPNIVTTSGNTFDIFGTVPTQTPVSTMNVPAEPIIPSMPIKEEISNIPAIGPGLSANVPAESEVPNMPIFEMPTSVPPVNVPAEPIIPSMPIKEEISNIPAIGPGLTANVPVESEISNIPTFGMPTSVPPVNVPTEPIIPSMSIKEEISNIPAIGPGLTANVSAESEVPNMPIFEMPTSVPPVNVPTEPIIPSMPIKEEISNIPAIGLGLTENSSIMNLKQNNQINDIPVTAPIIESNNLNSSASTPEIITEEVKPFISSPVTANEFVAPQPIIVTDYTKQYDPIMPERITEPVSKVDFKEIINAIRECSQKIEKYGYKIDVEEYDLSTLYQVVFKIEK